MYSKVYTSNAVSPTSPSDISENTRESHGVWSLPPLPAPPRFYSEVEDVWLVEAMISRAMFIPGFNSSEGKWKSLVRDFNAHFAGNVSSVELREHALGELYHSLLVVLGEADDIGAVPDEFITSTSALQITRDLNGRHQVSSDFSSSAETINSYMAALDTLSNATDASPTVSSSSRYERLSPQHQHRDARHQHSTLFPSYNRSTVDLGVFSEDNTSVCNDCNCTSSSDSTDDDDNPSAVSVHAGGTECRGDHRPPHRRRSSRASMQYAYPVHTSSEQRKGRFPPRSMRSMRASSPNALYNAFFVPMIHEPLHMTPTAHTGKVAAAQQASHMPSSNSGIAGSARWLLMHRDRGDASTMPQLRTVNSMHAAAEHHARRARETQERERVQKALTKAEKITNAFSEVWVDVRLPPSSLAGDPARSSSQPSGLLPMRTPHPLSEEDLCAALSVHDTALRAKQWLDADDCYMRTAHSRAVLAAQARHAVVGRELAARRANGPLASAYAACGAQHAYAPASCAVCGVTSICACLCAAAASASAPWRWTYQTMAHTCVRVTHADRVRGNVPSPGAPSTGAASLAAPHTLAPTAGGASVLPQLVAAALTLARAPPTLNQRESCPTPGRTPGVAVQTDAFAPAGVYHVYHTHGAQAARAAVYSHGPPLSCGVDSRGAYTTHSTLPQPNIIATCPGHHRAPLLAAAETMGVGAGAESLAEVLGMELVAPQPTAPSAAWEHISPEHAVATAACDGAVCGTVLDSPLAIAGSALLAPLQQLHVLHASAQRLATQVGPVSLAPVLGAYERKLLCSVHAALHSAAAHSAHFYSGLLEAGLHACVPSLPDTARSLAMSGAPLAQVMVPRERARLCAHDDHERHGSGAAARAEGGVWWRAADAAILTEESSLVSEHQSLTHSTTACTAGRPQPCSGPPLCASESVKDVSAGHAWVRAGSALTTLSPTAELCMPAAACPRSRAGMPADCGAWVADGALQRPVSPHSSNRHNHNHHNPLVTGAHTGRFVKLVKVSREEAASMSVDSVHALLKHTESVGTLPAASASCSRAEGSYTRVGRSTYRRVPHAVDLPTDDAGAGTMPLRDPGPTKRSRPAVGLSSTSPGSSSSSSRSRSPAHSRTRATLAASSASPPPHPYHARGCSCGWAPLHDSTARTCTVRSPWRPPEPLPLRPGAVVPTFASVTRAAAAAGVRMPRRCTAMALQPPPVRMGMGSLVAVHSHASSARADTLETDFVSCAECDGREALRRARIAPCLPWAPPCLLASARGASTRVVETVPVHASLQASVAGTHVAMTPRSSPAAAPIPRAPDGAAGPTSAGVCPDDDPGLTSVRAAALASAEEDASLNASRANTGRTGRTSLQESPRTNHASGLCTNAAIVTSDDDLYSSDDDVYSSDDDLYSSDDDLYSSDDNVCSSDDNVCSSDDNVCSSDDNLYSSEDNLYSSEDDLYSSDGSDKEACSYTESPHAPRKTIRSVAPLGSQGQRVWRARMRQPRVRGDDPICSALARDFHPSSVCEQTVVCTPLLPATDATSARGFPQTQRQRRAAAAARHHIAEPFSPRAPPLYSALPSPTHTAGGDYRMHCVTLTQDMVELSSPSMALNDTSPSASYGHSSAQDQTTSSALGPGFALYQHLAQLAAQRVFRGALAWDWVPIASCLAHFPTQAQQAEAQRHHHGLSLLQELDPSSVSLLSRPECGAGDPSRVTTLPAASLLARGRLGAWRCSFHALVRTIGSNVLATRVRDARGPLRTVSGGRGGLTNAQRPLARVGSPPLAAQRRAAGALSLSLSGVELSIAEECVARLDSGAMQVWMLRTQSWADLLVYSRHNPYLRWGPPALAYALELGWLSHSARAFDSRVDSLVRTSAGLRVCSTAPVAAPAAETSLFPSMAPTTPATLARHPPVSVERPRTSSVAKDSHIHIEARAVSFLSRLRPLGLDVPVLVRATIRCCREGIFGDCYNFPPRLSSAPALAASSTQLPRQLSGVSGAPAASNAPTHGVGTGPAPSHDTRPPCVSLEPVAAAALAHAVGPQLHPLLLKTLRPFEACHAVVHACAGLAGLLHSSLFFELVCRLAARVLAWRVGGLVTGTARWLPWAADGRAAGADRASPCGSAVVSGPGPGGRRGATAHPAAHARPSSSSSSSSFSASCARDSARVPPLVRATLEAPPFLFPPKPKARGSTQTEQATTSLLRQRLSGAAPPYDLSPRVRVLLRWHVAVQQHAALHQLAAAALVRLSCAHEDHALVHPHVAPGARDPLHPRGCGCAQPASSPARLYAPLQQVCKPTLALSLPTQVRCCQCGHIVCAPSLRLLLAVPGVYSTSATLNRHKSQGTLNEAVSVVVKRAYTAVPCICGASWPCSSHSPTSLPEHIADVDWTSITLTRDVAMIVDAVPVSLPKLAETAPETRSCACLVAETMLRWAIRHLHVHDGVYMWTLPPASKWSHLLQCPAVLSLLYRHASFLRASEARYNILTCYAQKCVADLFIRRETIEKTAAHAAEAELQWKRERISLARTRERNLCGDLELEVVRGELRSANRHHHIFSTLAPKPLHQGRIVRTTSVCDMSSNKDEDEEHHQDMSILEGQHADVSVCKTQSEPYSHIPLCSTNTLIDSSSSAEDAHSKRQKPRAQVSQVKDTAPDVVTLTKRTQLDDD